MTSLLESPWRTAAVGLALAALVLVAAAVQAGAGGGAAFAMLMRALHVLAAVVWGGFIVFVNLVQLVALGAASDSERPAIVRHVVPRTATVFTGAAHATLATGLVMLVPLHAALGARPLLLLSIVGGIAMWAIVQFVLQPNIRRITGRMAASDAEKATARVTILRWARINLLLVLPVTVGMLVAAHWGV